MLLLVGLGGAAGSLLRHVTAIAVEPVDGFPVATLLVNLVGALALGVVVTLVASVRVRALLGTGLLGGFTTYSAFALQTHDLLAGDEPALGVAYALATVTGGYVLALTGLALGRTLRGRGGAR